MVVDVPRSHGDIRRRPQAARAGQGRSHVTPLLNPREQGAGAVAQAGIQASVYVVDVDGALHVAEYTEQRPHLRVLPGQCGQCPATVAMCDVLTRMRWRGHVRLLSFASCGTARGADVAGVVAPGSCATVCTSRTPRTRTARSRDGGPARAA